MKRNKNDEARNTMLGTTARNENEEGKTKKEVVA